MTDTPTPEDFAAARRAITETQHPTPPLRPCSCGRKPRLTIDGHGATIECRAYQPGCDYVYAETVEHAVQRWNSDQAKELVAMMDNPAPLRSIPVERAETPVEQRQTRAEGEDSAQNSDAK